MPDLTGDLLGPFLERYGGAPIGFLVVYAELVALPLLVLAARRGLAALRPARVGDGVAVVVAVAVCAVVAGLLPSQPIDTNHHGYEELIAASWLGWFDRGGIGHLHGYLPVAIARCTSLVGVGLFGVVRAAGAVALLALGTLVLRHGGRRDQAVAVVLLTGLHPVWLRTSASESNTVVMVAVGLLAILAVDAFLKAPSAAGVALVGLLTVMTMQCRAEAVLLGPVAVLAYAFVQDPTWWRRTTPAVLAGVAALAAVLLLPRAQGLLGAMATTEGVSMMTSRKLPSMLPLRLPSWLLLARAVAAVAVVGGIGWVTRPERARWPAWTRSPAVGAALALALGGGLWLAWPHVDDQPLRWAAGSLGVVPPTMKPWVQLGTTVDARLVGRVLPALSVVGAVAVAWTPSRGRVAVVLGAVAAVAFYAGLFDALGSLYRWSAPAVPWMAVLAGWGLEAALGRVGRGPALPVLALAVLGPVLVPRWPLLSHTYPVAAEWALVEALHERPERTVVVLGPDDLEPGVDPGTWRSTGRDALPYALGVAGLHVVDVHTALADPAAVAGAIWFRSLACARGLTAWDEGTHRVLVDGRLVHPTRWVGIDGDGFDPDQPLPCWDRPDLLTCAEAGQRTCQGWGCTAVPEAPTPYLDPLCRRLEATLGGDVLATREVPSGNLVTTADPALSTGPLAVIRLPDALPAGEVQAP